MTHSSLAGLTFSNVRNSQGFSLLGGAIQRSQNSILILDEFDKTSLEIQDKLSDTIDNAGSVNIAKAGTLCNIKNNVTFIGLCNYSHSKYDERQSYKQNIR